MADDKGKPPPFRAGADTISAAALNMMRDAIPGVIKGGAGIIVEKIGDKIIIRLADTQGDKPGTQAIAMITDPTPDNYLVCDRDGVEILVAKPWALRGGVAYPTGPVYTYDDAQTRTAVLGAVTEDQEITPTYEVGEEILITRLPSARIEDEEEDVRWVDANAIGRCWAQVEDV